ncbi:MULTISPECIES: hypothetical protein [unclassified Streptomyces]|uniref:hypothetical protein n=1 Tax=unclassified Streptomyces TaxID=2593676 RepID=UPI001FD37DF8|nr:MULTISPECIES: hypothetical protein [unclassified Streptomyces]MDH3033994.1 hypothetical protein [Streptomyces sp. TRM75561]
MTTLTPGDVPWIEAPDAVLGADRPLGTWLRARPQAMVYFNVLFPEADQCKTDEVTDEQRIRLDLVDRVAVAPATDGSRITASHPGGGAHTFVVDTVHSNMSSTPAALPGLITGADGYCPPDKQNPRILVAGDLKSARMQRITVVMRDGGRASLIPYYEAQAVLS